MKLKKENLVISGVALLLFGILLAVLTRSPISWIIGGLWLAFALISCFTEDEK